MNTEQQSGSASPAPAPNPAGFDSWSAYWTAHDMPWRTEPEIDEPRQRYLTERRAIQSDVERGIYPFKDVNLTRADVEWLLATHESSGTRGPVDWSDERQRTRAGLDLRGTLLSCADLSALPLARVLGGLRGKVRETATDAQRSAAAIHLERSILYDAHLEDAVLSDSHLEGATLGGTFGHRAHLELAKLIDAHLEGADCSYARFDGAAMSGVHLEVSALYRAHLDRTELRAAHLSGARLTRAHLEGALLDGASFAGTTLASADLARLHAADLPLAPDIPPADLREAFFDPATSLTRLTFGDPATGCALLADVRWNDVNLAVVDWTHTHRGLFRRRIEAVELGDEHVARAARDPGGNLKDAPTRLREYADAVRANRQLATALRGQGLSEDADRYAYRAQKLARQVLWRQRRYRAALGSWLLDAIAGYGYRPGRALVAYVLVILAFTALYLLNAQFSAPHLSWDEALVLSISSFHGRGFFTSGITFGDTLARLAAAEAIIGLLIEITFIATFTNRFFAR
jgi:uncharacterized protein YjbI with pentapeptide repeats